MTKEKITFEEAYEKLETAAKKIMNDRIPLEEAVECYRDGLKYHEICSSILEEAEQLIQIYDRQTGKVKEMEANE